MANLVDFEFKPTDADIVMHNKCDKYDIMLSVGCGAVAGLVDSFFVGMPGASKLGTWTDKMTDNLVINFAKKLGWKPKKGNENNVASAIGFFERKFKVVYDARYAKDLGIDKLDMSPSNHHLKSLGHSPDIIGLFFSVLDQFNGTTSIISNGEITIVKTPGGPELKGKSFPAKLFCGTVNWLGHIMSDVAGTSGGRGHDNGNRGSGVGAPFFELFQFCDFGSFNVNNEKLTIAEMSTKIFESGYDARFFAAAKIPVILGDLLTRITWAIKKRFYDKLPTKVIIRSVIFSSLAPDSLRHCQLICMSSFCVIDVVDAAIRSGGEWLTFFLHINFPGWYKLIRLSLRELCIKLKIATVDVVIADIELFNAQLKDYLSELEKIDVEKWKQEVAQMEAFTKQINEANSEEELTIILVDSIKLLGGHLPWGDDRDFEEFMSDPTSVLVFE